MRGWCGSSTRSHSDGDVGVPLHNAQLLELMRMEEMAGRQGQHDRKRMLSAKIDAQMHEETQGALAHIISLHKKQRASVYVIDVRAPPRAWVGPERGNLVSFAATKS